MIFKSSLKLLLFLVIILFIFPSPAHAHLIGGNGGSSGLTHPLLGLDHLLAMVAVGIISTQIGGQKGIWVVPSTFVSFMIAGGLMAILGIGLPFVETAIALSVLVLGIAIALSKKILLPWAIICVALFAIFHGHAHGEEIPAIANPALYTAGFVLSTTLLHISGVFIGQHARRTKFSLKMLRYSGVAISLAGLFFLIGI